MSEIVEISFADNELKNSRICAILLLCEFGERRGGRELKMLKLLISDASEEFRLALADQLKNTYVIRLCQEGNETLEQMRIFRPDVMILDLTLPGMDGISLLHRASAEGIYPVVLATTRFLNEYVQRSAEFLGVGYLMMKPCDVNATIARLSDLTQEIGDPLLCRPDQRTIVSNLLLSLGIQAKLRGYSCLVEAILEKMRDPEQQTTKELYPAVARICGGNGKQIERAIRSAIASAWENREENLWRLYFQTDAKGEVKRPSNSQFISCLSARIGTGWDSECGNF